MTYIENIFICMVSPLLVAALCMGRRQLRFFLFCIAGMGVCLLSAYINTFLAAVCQADALAATAEIAPVVEEIMKLLPLVFYLLVFEPEGDKIKAAAITIALAFATFENVCYLIQNGADRFSFIFFRGFGTGAMHVLCGLIVGGGLAYTWRRTWLKIAGTCGLLGAAITLHAIYNLLIAYGGAAQYIAYALPVLLVAALCMGRRQLRFFLFCIAGMGVCLLSAYINTFLAAVCQADALAATAEIAPVVEEMMKLLPLVFYLLVFEPESERIKPAAITVTLSFATFENVCYLIQNGADRFSFIFFRGFGTGAMHVLCGLIVGGGLAYTWRRTWLKIAGTCGLLGAAITLHAIYNLLIAYGGAAQYIAYALPVLLVAAGRWSAFRLSQRK